MTVLSSDDPVRVYQQYATLDLLNLAFFGAPDPDRTSPRRTRNVFTGNDRRVCELTNIALQDGIDLDAQLLPEGDQCFTINRYPERLADARSEFQLVCHGLEFPGAPLSTS